MKPSPAFFAQLYRLLAMPVTEEDCGRKCGPYNEGGVPFCCDPRHALPTLYREEWAFLQPRTTLWRLWTPEADDPEAARLAQEVPETQVPAVCRGVAFCQREYRSLVCRAFPFFPYIGRENAFWGLAYYWQFEDRCWVLSHLDRVRMDFRQAFVTAYERLFTAYPQERETFRYHSQVMRRLFARQGRDIPLLHRDGHTYLINPRDESMTPVDPARLPKHGVYRLEDELPFPDEAV